MDYETISSEIEQVGNTKGSKETLTIEKGVDDYQEKLGTIEPSPS